MCLVLSSWNCRRLISNSNNTTVATKLAAITPIIPPAMLSSFLFLFSAITPSTLLSRSSLIVTIGGLTLTTPIPAKSFSKFASLKASRARSRKVEMSLPLWYISTAVVVGVHVALLSFVLQLSSLISVEENKTFTIFVFEIIDFSSSLRTSTAISSKQFAIRGATRDCNTSSSASITSLSLKFALTVRFKIKFKATNGASVVAVPLAIAAQSTCAVEDIVGWEAISEINTRVGIKIAVLGWVGIDSLSPSSWLLTFPTSDEVVSLPERDFVVGCRL
mmetsp:Transcript_580/g.705  ORF Transcript_580/g.705 Transcript_580/m.705 type:complete len:276 (-) Transcript_580:3544-4371(-)